ncbi:MAG: D-serine ammonia-lyase [Lautropia sp.]|nr:D-serine ammonia-lyase [Lautropia sp.]
MIDGKSLQEWRRTHPLIDGLVALRPVAWFNPAVVATAEALQDVRLGAADVADASARLQRFAPCIARLFPETADAGGIIESGVCRLSRLQPALVEAGVVPADAGALWLKTDNALPISGSIKARGGIYEVLKHAEGLALAAGLIREGDDYARLASDEARAFFGNYRIAVGSTGNLGLSIGIMGAALGFRVSVHMSADARAWKKAKLRAHGVEVVEYTSDYSAAVAEGRRQAESDPTCHFVDDENSADLFLGYAVAAERLKTQLDAAGVRVDEDHPLFVYLPCGVGGGPGGVAFGLKLGFGDAVHCIFAEPTHSPCMLLGVHTGLHEAISVQDIGIDNRTAADGLAVGRPSGFVGRQMQRLIEGYCTVADENLFAWLKLTHQTEGIRLEPSALAGIVGIGAVLSDAAYRSRIGLNELRARNATHLVWATGGNMVPDDVFAQYLMQGA